VAPTKENPVVHGKTLRWSAGQIESARDSLAVEEPLEIRLGGRRFTLTMRTPGHDEDLAAGFLFAEGFINSIAELGEIRSVRDSKGQPEPNSIDIVLSVPAEDLRERLSRNFAITSSCGICGRTSIESLTRRIATIDSAIRVTPDLLLGLGPKLGAVQEVFAMTGGLHAAGLFDLDGNLIAAREDIGRHNAVDKVIGYALNRGMLPLSRNILMVSGRLSFEIVQKAAAAGVPILAAVSAPSSLAVELAEETGVTLVGFLRTASFNVYSHPERIER
jgi:formate dehydrogenase accessory protein FdhD